jgi:methylenetetrahydrofolate dehydrogenase (NADP+) / methenyltetrahydrofolate cyclohydrolase
MSAILIDGKLVSQQIREEVRGLAAKLKDEHGTIPGLAFILVGNNPASEVYVRNKAKACEALGFYSITEKMPEDAPQQDVIDKVEEFNLDERVHGILVQMPLPKHMNEYEVIEAIDPSKDVDALHPFNIGLYSEAKSWTEITDKRLLLPCTPYGMMILLEKYGIEVSGKKAVVVGRSNLGGKPTAALLLSKNATVTIAHSKTQDLAAVCREADILVAVIGKANFIKADFIKPGAAVLDVGINRTETGLVGDVDYEAAKEVAGWITPVPGGVGAMTISMLMKNTYMAASRKAGEASSKIQPPSSKQTPKTKSQTHKPFDFEERALLFAHDVIKFINTLPKTPANIETSKQLIRSSGAVGANYIEASESLGKKDFSMRLKISRKEAKETRYWLKLLECEDSTKSARSELIEESTELLKILSAMIQKSS